MGHHAVTERRKTGSASGLVEVESHDFNRGSVSREIIPYIYELTMTKGDKAIKYMVKNAKARKNLKKVKKMRKKHDVCACVGVRVADNKISGSEQ